MKKNNAAPIPVNAPAADGTFDVIIISGDAYVDHPSFGAAVIARFLQAKGFSVGVIAQPDWKDRSSVTLMGRPRLYFGITAGNLDSMLAHYTAFKKKRSEDAYTPGGKAGKRPDRATIVYTNLVRQAFPDSPVIIGGIEAGMRKLIHYDYWDDRLRESILVDSGADMLVYGMAEKTALSIARSLQDNGRHLTQIPGTAVRMKAAPPKAVKIASWDAFERDDYQYMKATLADRKHASGKFGSKPLAQETRAGDWIVVNPPPPPVSPHELDAVYELPFTREPAACYTKGSIPGVQTTEASVVSHRGCGGACHFCSLAFHQGRRIVSRSPGSVIREIRSLQRRKGFSGTVSDLGGPTANAYGFTCTHKYPASCKRGSCLSPRICPNFRQAGPGLRGLLDQVQGMYGIKNVFISSGIRHDLLLLNKPLLKRIAARHVPGHLKVAPEHSVPAVLAAMDKCDFHRFETFLKEFRKLSAEAKKKQYLVPYFISGHPGCTMGHMKDLAGYLKQNKWKVQQVQAFIPLPGTVSAAMYYTGKDVRGKRIYVARDMKEKRDQFRTLLWYKKDKI